MDNKSDADALSIIERDKRALSEVMKLRFNPLVVKEAHGSVLTGADGKEYLDLSAGWGVANIGYAHPRLLRRTAEQAKKLSFLSTISMINEESVALAEKLKQLVPGGKDMKVWYGHSGSDANEFIAKIVPAWTGRPRILTFTGSYHGQTMGAYGMSGHPSQSHFVAGAGVLKLPYPYCYRCPFGRTRQPMEASDGCDMFCLSFIRDYVLGSVIPAQQVGALVCEAIQCDGGDVVPPPGFMRGLSEIAKEHGILFIYDEVKIGFGRTGAFFGFEADEVQPDAMVMGKPMGGGHPLSAVIGRQDLMDAGTGLHLFTTAGNPLACAASRETIAIITEEHLTQRAAQSGAWLLEKLRALQTKMPCIGEVRGRGLVIGVELVGEDGSPDTTLAALVSYRAYELGVIFYCTGIYSNVLELTPPLVITEAELARALAIIEEALRDAVSGRVDREKALSYAGWGT